MNGLDYIHQASRQFALKADSGDTSADQIARLAMAGALLVRAIDEELGMCGFSPPARPRIVCLCGSTRFEPKAPYGWREFQRASLAETLAGRIVLSIGAASGTDDEHFGNLPRDEYERVKRELDELHLRKIDLADEIYVLNVGQYIGDSTRREIAYAESIGKPVRYLEPLTSGQGARGTVTWRE